MPHLKACHCCGLIHAIPELSPGDIAACTRCDSIIVRPGWSERSAACTAATALGAFFLFWPAILLPILQVEKLGHRSTSSILTGIVELFSHGSWFVGGVVFVFSIAFPLTKIVMLLELSLLKVTHQRFRSLTYRIMEHAGKWSMMDVMLLAFLVMLVKLGSLIEFQFGPAVVAFVLCVALSMVASMSFDPHAIWSDDDQNVDPVQNVESS
ncbi:MAG: paraquat-inducible protein A [Rhodopirellula sp.]|nr:paraquat-inducible protein A [Rhodopirellula sp.]